MNKESLIEQLQKIAVKSADICDYIIITREADGVFRKYIKIGDNQSASNSSARTLPMIGALETVKHEIIEMSIVKHKDD
jgi:hypothetical protein